MKSSKAMALLFAMSLSIGAFAQKIEESVLQFEYTQQPTNPLVGLEEFSFTVTTTYPENNDELIAKAKADHQKRLDEHPTVVAEAKKEHEKRLESYDESVALAQENFKLETEAYNNLSAIEKLAQEEGRPKLRMPSKPGEFRPPSEPVYYEPNTSGSIIYRKGELADTYINLEGFRKGTTNALIGTIDMAEFDAGQPERKESTSRVYNTVSKQYENKTTYSYETSVRRPTRLVLKFKGESIYNDIFEGTGEYTTITTTSSPNMFQMEKDNVSDIMKGINTFINQKHGFVKIPSTVTIFAPKNKGDYDDLENAAKQAKRGINPMGSSDGKAELEEAIKIWVNVLGESDVNDKKARINEKITQSIYQCLIEAHIFKEEFIKAQDYLVLLGEMDLKNTEKKWVEGRTAFIAMRLGK